LATNNGELEGFVGADESLELKSQNLENCWGIEERRGDFI
jgi:hypothetical protein